MCLAIPATAGSKELTELLQGRALDSLENFAEAGFDMEEIASVANLEIHFVDSSGVIHWNFVGDTPDFPFADWNFSTTTEEDYAWLCECIHAEGKDIYVADFTEQGAYSCRILVPGMSEIYPVEDLEWENNSIGNDIRPALVELPQLSDAESAALLADLQTSNLNDERPLWEILGTLGADMEGSEMHQTLLAAYDKLFAGTAPAL